MEKENTQLKRIVANQALDIDMLKFVAEGKFGKVSFGKPKIFGFFKIIGHDG